MLDVIRNAHTHGARVSASAGGWNFNDPNYNGYVAHQNHQTAWIYTTMCSQYQYRNQFIKSIVQYVKDWGFDGFDIDWVCEFFVVFDVFFGFFDFWFRSIRLARSIMWIIMGILLFLMI